MGKEPSCTIFSSSSLSRLIREERGRRRLGERISPAISPPPSSFQSPDPPRLPPPPTSPAAKVVPVSGIFLLSLLLLPPLETRLSSPPSPLDPFPSARRWVGGGKGGEEEERPPAEKHQRREIRPPKRTSCHQGQKHMVELPAKIALSLKTRNIIFFHKRARNSFLVDFLAFFRSSEIPALLAGRHPFLACWNYYSEGGRKRGLCWLSPSPFP